jgi:VCBS repeat-containing protein
VTITDAATGAYTFTPALNYNGPASFTFKANDGALDSNVATVSISVKAINDAPMADAGILTTAEDTLASGRLIANDVDNGNLTYSIVTVPSAAQGIVTLTNAATGAYTFSPALNFNGSASFSFKANDGALDSNVATISITVTAVNDAPVAAAGNLTTAEDNGTARRHRCR